MLTAMTACAPRVQEVQPCIVATIAPLQMIAQEICGEAVAVRLLAPPGASAHTFELRPAQAEEIARALCLLYVHEDLDGWAARVPAHARIQVFDLVPDNARLPNREGVPLTTQEHTHSHGETDPHFWSDPLLTAEVGRQLARRLGELLPTHAAVFSENALRFKDAMEALDKRLHTDLAHARGQAVILMHPSWNYFLHRYGIRLAAVVEPAPGREPGPQYMERLTRLAETDKVRAIFAEPQLPPGPARALAEAAGLPLLLLDPYGGVPGRETYTALIDSNARTLAEALR
jgi:ABC-type Zn uptake system ZnuABC Zn-binding protein ZnuA